MAVYFAPYYKGTQNKADFIDVDEAMCNYFGAPCDPKEWHRGWYNLIGLALAAGKSWDQIRFLYPDLAGIANWLEARYDVDSWAGR